MWRGSCSSFGHDASRTPQPHEEVRHRCDQVCHNGDSSTRINDRIAAQLTDAATATASGYRAACRARSHADFIYKLGNCIEEADESALWLEIVIETPIAPKDAAAPLWKEADELTRILVSSRETARRNRR